MLVDQEWVIENFNIIDEIFTRLNKSDKNLDRERKNMKNNMDKLKFRGYYELARKQEKDKINKAKTIGDRKRYQEDQLIRSMNDDSMKRCIDVLENQLDEKDKQIESLLKTIESITSISQMKSLSVS